MKFNIKSRKGFTLIELLVVIGILAVLAAIAIPSVAGLIDRANVSADKTNSNEMTNAIERFASEYELYCQDIASGTLDPNNLDSAQGRVKNVVGVTTRAGIEGIEKPQSATAVGTTGIAIYRDTKYPVNAETMKKVVENYTKTSSSTFEPKQSDMHYWYSPDCGVVVVAEPTKTAAELDKYVISGIDAKGNDITSNSVNAQWIDLTLGATLSGGSVDLSTVNTDLVTNTWADVQKVAQSGKAGDYYSIGDTKTLQINGATKTATIIGINHEGVNGITFMIVSSDGIGNHTMNTADINAGGWEASEMHTWLNEDIYNSMSNKDYIKEVTKMTNNIGENGNSVTGTQDKVFLLSPKEAGVEWVIADEDCGWPDYPGMNALNNEGTIYEWFESNTVDGWFWLRSPYSAANNSFFRYSCSSLESTVATVENTVCPAFVIG